MKNVTSKLNLFIIVYFSLVIISCGGGGGDDATPGSGGGGTNNTPLTGTDTDLVGSWSRCVSQATFSLRSFYKFNSDGTYQWSLTTYTASGCNFSDALPSATLSGTYGAGQGVSISSGNTATQIEGRDTAITQLPSPAQNLDPIAISRGLYLIDASKTLLYLNLASSANNDPEYPTDLPLMIPLTKL